MQRFLCHFRNYSVAVFSTLTATWLRLELEPILESRVPFGLFFISSLLTAWLAGTGPAVLAAVLSLLAAAHFIIPPSDSLFLNQPSDLFSLGIYLVVTLASILLFHQSAVQQRLAEKSAEENARLNAGLIEADTRKDEFLALLAHELRNPLTPIQTAVDLLDADPALIGQSRLPIETIRRQLRQLIRLVNDLLDASRFVHGKICIKSEPFLLEDAIQIAIETNQAALDERNHQFYVCLPDLPIRILGDLPRMSQAIFNVLHNATKYTHRGGHIRLSVTYSTGFVTIRIEDDGMGIPSELKARIFELFTQVNSSRSRREGGLGIGLALVRQLVHLHAGTISVASDGPGQGSRFTIELPCLPHCDLQPEVPPMEPAKNLPRPESSSLDELKDSECEKPKILMIDDNTDSSEMLGMLLQFEGFETRSASEGISGIRLGEQFRPEIILLDIGLPGMDGYEVAAALRKKTIFDDTVIIAVSGWDGAEYRRLSLDAGIDDHLAKPFVPGDLVNLIRHHLERKSLSFDTALEAFSE